MQHKIALISNVCWQSNASGESTKGRLILVSGIVRRSPLGNCCTILMKPTKKKSYGTDMGKAQETEVENWVVRSDNIK
jgi:hypothetical protein